MSNQQNKSAYSRRTFLKTSVALGIGSVLTKPCLAAVLEQTSPIAIVTEPEDDTAMSKPARWALGELVTAIEDRGSKVRRLNRMADLAENEFAIMVSGMDNATSRQIYSHHHLALPSEAESLCIFQARAGTTPVLLCMGFDALGLVYALTELADRIRLLEDRAEALQFAVPVIEQPASRTRSIIRNFSSELEDKPWFYDHDYWKTYLDMLVSARINRFNFATGMGYDSARRITDGYMVFPYPFFVDVPGYQVTARGLSGDERERNLEMLKFIGRETTRRGIRFQFSAWTLAYQWTESPDATYVTEGLSRETHAAYCRDALSTLLKEVPDISGVTFRVHHESGIPLGSQSFWEIQFSAIAGCGRKVEIDMHAKNMEEETLQAALATGQPVVVSPKFIAEHLGLPYHQASIRELEMPEVDQLVDPGEGLLVGNRRFTRYGYADMLSENRNWDIVYRIWPGTQRFLLSGDPATFAGYGNIASFCGAAGFELSEPLMFKGRRGTATGGGRCAYLDASLNPRYDFEKYRYTYRLWGRLCYHPGTDPEVWRRALKSEFGSAALHIENALAHATRVLPLFMVAHAPSAACSRYWPEIYQNLPMVAYELPVRFDTREPKRFGNVSPLDPQLFHSPDETADAIALGHISGKYSVLEVAQWLDELADGASRNLQTALETIGDARTKPGFRRVEEDVLIQIGLARFFASKLRSGVFWRFFLLSGNKAAGNLALDKYREGLEIWKAMAMRAQGVYQHYIGYGVQGHWIDRIPDFEKDIRVMQETLRTTPMPANPLDETTVDRAIHIASSPIVRPIVRAVHRPLELFQPGAAFPVGIEIPAAASSVNLWYRHVNQSERWMWLEMKRTGDTYEAAIPADYTRSRFPLQYYFEIMTGEKKATMFPALNEDLSNVPYFTVRRSGDGSSL